MDPVSLIAVAACLLLAVNVGGNNSAAEMGPAFGSGIRSRMEAVILIAIFSMAGALLAGGHVVKTIGSDLIGQNALRHDIRNVVAILLSATSIIALANGLRVPIATAHAMVGSVVGLGLYSASVQWHNVGKIVAWWLVTPAAALIVSYLLGRYAFPPLDRRLAPLSQKGGPASMFYRGFVTISGCYMAFNAGSNSLAKAVGPIVGAGILSTQQAAILGGLCMAAGAFVVGHHLMRTVGKEITPLCPLKATMVELVCGTILLIASMAGVPISLAETVTCSVIGFGAAHSGLLLTAQNRHIRRLYVLWPVCPLYTTAVSYGAAWMLDRFF